MKNLFVALAPLVIGLSVLGLTNCAWFEKTAPVAAPAVLALGECVLRDALKGDQLWEIEAPMTPATPDGCGTDFLSVLSILSSSEDPAVAKSRAYVEARQETIGIVNVYRASRGTAL